MGLAFPRFIAAANTYRSFPFRVEHWRFFKDVKGEIVAKRRALFQEIDLST